MLVDGVGGDDNNSGKRKRDDEDVSSHKEENGAANEASAPPVQDKDIGIADLSQAELVRRAFAAPANLEAEAEFEKEKVSVHSHRCNIFGASHKYAVIVLFVDNDR